MNKSNQLQNALHFNKFQLIIKYKKSFEQTILWELKMGQQLLIQNIQTKGEDKSSESAKYKIITYGADFTLEVLYSKMVSGEIVIPDFQRRYVWTNKRASRLIESFLLGLPVPQVFLYREEDSQDLLVVDGHQRLKTIEFFFSGKYDTGKPFKLRGVQSRWEGKKFSDLTKVEQRYLKNSVLRSTIFEQTDPCDNTSMFEIFNRLNTGGMPLSSQEIRNCLFRGNLVCLLDKLNEYETWRNLLGTTQPDKRMRDIEMILRFFALKDFWPKYSKTMRDFLSDYMALKRNISQKEMEEYSKIFKETIDKIYDEIGPKAFRLVRSVNIAVFDSVMVALVEIGLKNIKNLKQNYIELLKSEDYRENVTLSTTDTDRVQGRIKNAIGMLQR